MSWSRSILCSILLSLSWNLFAASEPAAPEKLVLALQAMLPQDSSQEIKTLCLSADSIEGARVAGFKWGAEPHITIGAWKVTAEEQAAALEQFTNHPELPKSITIACHLERSEYKGKSSWFIVPKAEDSTKLDEFRKQIMQSLNWDYEEFQGRNQSEWYPHLTLIGMPNEKIPEAKQVIEKLEQITSVQLSSFALVGFKDGIHTLAKRTLSD